MFVCPPYCTRSLCQNYTYPRTYGSFIKCLKAGRHLDNGEESQGESVYHPHLPDNHGWFRCTDPHRIAFVFVVACHRPSLACRQRCLVWGINYQHQAQVQILEVCGLLYPSTFCCSEIASASSDGVPPTAFARHRLRLRLSARASVCLCICVESPGQRGEMDRTTQAKVSKTVRTTWTEALLSNHLSKKT